MTLPPDVATRPSTRKRSLLSERYDGTLADFVAIPTANLVPMPAALSFEQAACLPTAWLTAFRMLIAKSATAPGDTVLVQGAGGGVSTALIQLAKAAGRRVWVTSRSEQRRAAGRRTRRRRCFRAGCAATRTRRRRIRQRRAWRPGRTRCAAFDPAGPIVTCGATSGAAPPAELNRVFFQQLRIIGSTMGTRQELIDLLDFVVATGVRPVIDRVLPLASTRDGLAALDRR